MDDADDYGCWYESALCYAELAAHQIARFKNPSWNPTWQDLVPSREFTVDWGIRRKRSRVGAETGFAKRDPAAAACSPATPLDFGSGSGSGASTSGGDEGSSSPAKRRCVFGGADISAAGGSCETKSVGNGRPPCVYGGSAARDLRRQGKKKTLCELQEEERLELGMRNTLHKEIEMRRVACESLKAENQRLKSQQLLLQSEKIQIKNVTTSPASVAPSSHTRFLIPDLNEPLSEKFI